MRNLQEEQEKMRSRLALRACEPSPMPEAPVNPVDYAAPVEYLHAAVVEFHHWPNVGGVYLLTEAGRFYIGQSADVAARFASHRLNPVCCGFADPRCVLLAAVSSRGGALLNESTHARLVAEARFIAAALSMEVPLTNKLSSYKRGKLLSLFSDLAIERKIIAGCLRHGRQ